MTSTVKVDLPAEIFDVQTNVPLLHQVVVAQLAAARQGLEGEPHRPGLAHGWRNRARGQRDASPGHDGKTQRRLIQDQLTHQLADCVNTLNRSPGC